MPFHLHFISGISFPLLGPHLAHLFLFFVFLNLLLQGWKDHFLSSPFPLSRRGELSHICSFFWVSDLKVRFSHLENACLSQSTFRKEHCPGGQKGRPSSRSKRLLLYSDLGQDASLLPTSVKGCCLWIISQGPSSCVLLC